MIKPSVFEPRSGDGPRARARAAIQRARSNGVGATLARGAFGSGGLKVAYSGVNFVTGLVLARWLGAAGYGAYAYAFTWIVVLSIPSGLGLDILLVREIAMLRSSNAWSRVRSRLNQSVRLSVLASGALAVAAAVVVGTLPVLTDSTIRAVLWVALVSLPLVNLNRIFLAAMQGIGRVVSGQLPSLILYPFLLLGLVVAARLLVGPGLTPALAMGLNVIAVAVAVAAGAVLLHRALPASPGFEASGAESPWTRSMAPLVLLAAIQIVDSNAPTLILGALRGPTEVGVYAVASRGAEMVLFFLYALLPPLAPTIAELYGSRDIPKLQVVVTRSVRSTFALALPVAVFLAILGRVYLGFFGSAFVEGTTALTILSVTQLVNVGAGPVAYLLTMTGNEADVSKTVAGSLTANVLLGLVLIPAYGVIGAAVASAASLVIWNVTMVFLVYRRTGIYSTVLGRLAFER